MFILGVTGGIGSGKTAATNQLAMHGIDVVDADTIAHQVVEVGSPALDAISAHFGLSILLPNGALDRQTLRTIIFKNAKEKEWLENYLHPIIRENIIKALNKSTSPYTILSAPLLLEKNLALITHKVLVIDCSEAIQIDRACRRDNSSIESIQKIMQEQLSRRERIARADDIIINDGTLEELETKIDQYHFALLSELATLSATLSATPSSLPKTLKPRKTRHMHE